MSPSPDWPPSSCVAIEVEAALGITRKRIDSTALRGKIDGKARGKKRHKARHKAKWTRRRAGWSAPPCGRGDDHDGLIGLDTKMLVDHLSSDADSLSPGERFRSSTTKAVLDEIELRCIASDAAVGSAMRRAQLGSLHWPVGGDASAGDCGCTSTSISIDVLLSRTRLDDGQGLRHPTRPSSPSH
jgi:hypothetical protein